MGRRRGTANAAKHRATSDEAVTVPWRSTTFSSGMGSRPKAYMAIGMSTQVGVHLVAHRERGQRPGHCARRGPRGPVEPISEDKNREPSEESSPAIPDKDSSRGIRPDRFANLRGAVQHAVFVERDVWDHVGSAELTLETAALRSTTSRRIARRSPRHPTHDGTALRASVRTGTRATLPRMSSATRLLTLCAVGLALLPACSPKRVPLPTPPPAPLLPVITFTVQVGAFAEAENAIRLARSLEAAGGEAFHFVGEDGLHRVRFGSFPSRESAARRAEALHAAGLIAEHAVVATPGVTRAGLRADIARAALSFLGQPYRWGAADGVRLQRPHDDGVPAQRPRLPRSSAEQYALGTPVAADRLREADLVFFDTETRVGPTTSASTSGRDVSSTPRRGQGGARRRPREPLVRPLLPDRPLVPRVARPLCREVAGLVRV